MDAEQAKALVSFIGAGMKVLSIRLVLVCALLMTFGLFVWAMVMPSPERIGAASIFMLGVFLPSLKADAKEKLQQALPQGE